MSRRGRLANRRRGAGHFRTRMNGQCHVRKRLVRPGPATYIAAMDTERKVLYKAVSARDARFDGVFFVGVTTTGVYCRPVCRARTPGRDRCLFFRTRAEAEREGFRACFRCRPELAPGQGPVDALPRLVARAVARIEAGDLNERSVDDLARSLQVSERHLRRALTASLGVGPVELAQSRRLALAKQLLQDTSLPL